MSSIIHLLVWLGLLHLSFSAMAPWSCWQLMEEEHCSINIIGTRGLTEALFKPEAQANMCK